MEIHKFYSIEPWGASGIGMNMPPTERGKQTWKTQYSGMVLSNVNV